MSNDDREYFEGHLVCHNSTGYPYIYDKDNEYGLQISSNGLTNIHMIVAKRIYGDLALDPNMEVHHLDLNKDNYDPSNIIVLEKGEHSALHNFLDKHPEYVGKTKKETKELIQFIKKNIDFKNGNVYHDTLLEIDRLILDDKLKNRKKIDELKEVLKRIRKENKNNLPEKEDLVKVLESNMSLNKTAKDFQVTTDIIRDWCNQYGIDVEKYLAYKVKKIIKTCPTCGKEFETTENLNRTFCSKECSMSYSRSKINTNDVLHLYYDEGQSQRKIAKKYGVSHFTILQILKENPVHKSSKKVKGSYVHNEEFCKKVCDYHKEFPNESQRSLGRKFDVDRTTIKAILEKYNCL